MFAETPSDDKSRVGITFLLGAPPKSSSVPRVKVGAVAELRTDKAPPSRSPSCGWNELVSLMTGKMWSVLDCGAGKEPLSSPRLNRAERERELDREASSKLVLTVLLLRENREGDRTDVEEGEGRV